MIQTYAWLDNKECQIQTEIFHNARSLCFICYGIVQFSVIFELWMCSNGNSL